MEQLTRDLSGGAAYMDDILVSGNSTQEHLENLRVLFRRLNEKGLYMLQPGEVHLCSTKC